MKLALFIPLIGIFALITIYVVWMYYIDKRFRRNIQIGQFCHVYFEEEKHLGRIDGITEYQNEILFTIYIPQLNTKVNRTLENLYP